MVQPPSRKEQDEGMKEARKEEVKPRIVMRSTAKRRKAGNARRTAADSHSNKRTRGSAGVVSGDVRGIPERASQRSGLGLPSFQLRHDFTEATLDVPVDDELGARDDERDQEEIPSDTLMAIQSLMQSARGIHIPLSNSVTNRGASSIQAVLEHQVMRTFVENHASSINSEMFELIQANKVRRLYCHEATTTAFVLTGDYVRAAWDAQVQYTMQQPAAEMPCTSQSLAATSEATVEWFLSNLHCWTGTSISMASFLAQWEADGKLEHGASTAPITSDGKQKCGRNFHTSLKQLLEMQLLIRDAKATSVQRNESFRLWLPQWGIALKAWSDARKQLLTHLSRGCFGVGGGLYTTATKGASKTKEISKANLLRQNRNSHISTQFLLDELLYKGKIRVVERPFGSFVQLVKDEAS